MGRRYFLVKQRTLSIFLLFLTGLSLFFSKITDINDLFIISYRFMVYCGPHEGRHTAALVAERVDAVIESLAIPGLLECHKALTTDNAANMLAACKEARHVQSNHGCFDHQLNLIVKNGLKRVPQIMKAVMAFKRLATATHKSTLYCERIRQECNDLEKSTTAYSTNIKYVKIIQPVDTRWNSTLMCIRSIINLETPLMEISKITGRAATKDKTVENLQVLIPSRADFAELRAIMPLLAVFEKVSELMSAEKTPTMCWVSYRAYYLKFKCDFHEKANAAMYPPGPEARNVKKLAAFYQMELTKRFKNNCTDLYEAAVCCILNPALKGFLVKDAGLYEKTVKEMIRREEGAPEPPAALNEAIPIDMDDEDDFMISQCTQGSAPTAGAAESPMTTELNLYMSIPKSSATIDILQFWHAHEKQFPSLAKVVKKYMCIQASSSSSERTFSASGNIVTPKRNKLDPENVNLLVYLKENLGNIKIPKLPPKSDKEDSEDEEEDGVLIDNLHD